MFKKFGTNLALLFLMSNFSVGNAIAAGFTYKSADGTIVRVSADSKPTEDGPGWSLFGPQHKWKRRLGIGSLVLSPFIVAAIQAGVEAGATGAAAAAPLVLPAGALGTLAGGGIGLGVLAGAAGLYYGGKYAYNRYRSRYMAMSSETYRDLAEMTGLKGRALKKKREEYLKAKLDEFCDNQEPDTFVDFRKVKFEEKTSVPLSTFRGEHLYGFDDEGKKTKYETIPGYTHMVVMGDIPCTHVKAVQKRNGTNDDLLNRLLGGQIPLAQESLLDGSQLPTAQVLRGTQVIRGTGQRNGRAPAFLENGNSEKLIPAQPQGDWYDVLRGIGNHPTATSRAI